MAVKIHGESIPLQTPQRPAFHHDSFLDTPNQIGSDATSTSRVLRDGQLFHGSPSHHELKLHIQTIVAADLSAGWVGVLSHRALSHRRALKWTEEQAWVTGAPGPEARRVREGLSAQVVLVTDVAEPAQRIDLGLLSDGIASPFAGIALKNAGSRWKGDPRLASLANFRGFMLRAVVDASGIGTLDRLVGVANRDSFGESLVEDRGMIDQALDHAKGRLSGSITIAAQSSVLTASLLDPEREIDHNVDWLESTRYSVAFPGRWARARLLRLSQGRYALDRDDASATSFVESCRQRAYATGDEWGLETDSGLVESVDDREYLRVQLSDLVCGYARDTIDRGGFAELVQRFRLVIYNGRILDRDAAKRLDLDRRQHRQLLRDHGDALLARLTPNRR